MAQAEPIASVDIAGYTGGSIAAKAGQFVKLTDLEGDFYEPEESS